MDDQLNNTLKQEIEESWIADLDPILEGGFKTAFRQLLAIEVRTVDATGNSLGVKDVLTVRIMIKPANEGYSDLKMELSSEANIFTVYICRFDEKKFDKIRKQQSLNFGFDSLLNMLIKQIKLCDQNINQYNAVLYLNKISLHKFDFIENIEYKRIDLISFEIEELDAESIKNYITYRFTKVKAKNQIIQNRLKDMLGIVKVKHPNLLTLISKKCINEYTNISK